MNYYFKDKRFKTRAWTFIVYPDSAPDNWRDILDELHIPWVESPLHDKDQNPTGEQKKLIGMSCYTLMVLKVLIMLLN